MMGGRTLAGVALVGGLLATSTATATQQPLYTRAATRSCLLKLPHAVAGLPPANPPVPPALFVDRLARDDLSTWGLGRRPRAHKQLAAWSGNRTYQGIILSFFTSVPDARASLRTLASLYGGKRIGNVVATWDQPGKPSRTLRNRVFGCLRSNAPPASRRRAPRASLATFAGRWGGHGRGLLIKPTGRGGEFGNASCCVRVYRLGFRILSVRGTLTRAAATYRVTSFRRYDRHFKKLRVGEVGTLLLRNGIVTNRLTGDFFCSEPAWGATGACGA